MAHHSGDPMKLFSWPITRSAICWIPLLMVACAPVDSGTPPVQGLPLPEQVAMPGRPSLSPEPSMPQTELRPGLRNKLLVKVDSSKGLSFTLESADPSSAKTTGNTCTPGSGPLSTVCDLPDPPYLNPTSWTYLKVTVAGSPLVGDACQTNGNCDDKYFFYAQECQVSSYGDPNTSGVDQPLSLYRCGGSQYRSYKSGTPPCPQTDTSGMTLEAFNNKFAYDTALAACPSDQSTDSTQAHFCTYKLGGPSVFWLAYAGMQVQRPEAVTVSCPIYDSTGKKVTDSAGAPLSLSGSVSFPLTEQVSTNSSTAGSLLGYYLRNDADRDGWGADPGQSSVLLGDFTARPHLERSNLRAALGSEPTDCDDAQGLVYPGAPELCNGLDDNCNDEMDERTCTELDQDQDGFTSVSGDCDDRNADRHPGAPELCNQQDDDCDSAIDEGLAQTIYFRDADQDGYGNEIDPRTTCEAAPRGYVDQATDCDDGNDTIHPTHSEDCDGLDNNCDGSIDEEASCSGLDNDGDKAAAPADCDDFNDQRYPGAVEVCNGQDDDCDGTVDEDFSGQCVDDDGDSWTEKDGDCDDTRAGVHPLYIDGYVGTPYTYDDDGDGYGDDDDPYGGLAAGCALPRGAIWLDLSALDCDDAMGSVNPGKSEVCDELDNNCDGMVDEGLIQNTPVDGQGVIQKLYPDQDGDGFGDPVFSTGCVPEGGVDNAYDCDDSDSSVYPGAADTLGDGVDKSCDGSDGMAPSVGLPTSTFTLIQSALDAALDGQTVWVGPGTYKEYGLSMEGKGVRLVSTEGEAATIIDAQGLDTVFYFNSTETEASVLEGFTLSGGEAVCNTLSGARACRYYGGGIFMDNASPTLTRVTFTANSAFDAGGGMSLESSSPTMAQVTFTGNIADSGGGLYLESSSPTLTEASFTGNIATFGGGLYLESSAPTLIQVTVSGNSATYYGGGMALGSSSPSLSQVIVTRNTASYYGGGLYLYDSSPTLTQVTFEENTTSLDGGGMYLYSSSPTLSQVTITGNTASYHGGGMYVDSSSPTLTNSSVAYNQASSSGGNFYRYGSHILFSNSSLFYNPSGWKADNIAPTGSYLTVEPKYLAYADRTTGASCTPGASTSCVPADLHPALGSPLINAGDSTITDVDGSRADIGSYGGQNGADWDVDGDGTPDYFWPGEWDDAPAGFDPNDYDCDDLDPDVQRC